VLFTWLQEGTQMQSPWAENIPGEWWSLGWKKFWDWVAFSVNKKTHIHMHRNARYTYVSACYCRINFVPELKLWRLFLMFLLIFTFLLWLPLHISSSGNTGYFSRMKPSAHMGGDEMITRFLPHYPLELNHTKWTFWGSS
jgi:hypothetical protein